MAMSYANMIEEKRLKKGFILATLVSTIAGTFVTGLNLYDRVAEKTKQKKRDTGQDEKIKELEDRVGEVSKKRGSSVNGGSRRGKDEDLRGSLEHSGPLVRREYDQNIAMMGSRFAQGDMVAQVQLQSQVITLQSSVIKLLEEALITGRPPDLGRLYNASEFAREGTIRALRDQYHRMLESAPVPRLLHHHRPGGPIRRTSSTPNMRDVAGSDYSSASSGRGGSSSGTRGGGVAFGAPPGYGPPPKALTYHESDPLFCAFAAELQRDARLPLDDDDLARHGCPDCGTAMAIDPGRAWRIEKEVVRERRARGPADDPEVVEVVESRTYALANRFVVKCHREGGGGYACCLCFRHRKSDTLWRSVGSLAEHVAKEHSVAECEMDPDIREMTVPYR